EVTARDFRTCHAFDARDRLDEVNVPSLAVVGEHDALTPPAYHEYLADRIDDCECTVIDDAAHLAMLERPAGFNAALSRFLTEDSDSP
ncbi:alpha/beta fold hydrolase, partial [Halorubrum pallidum]